MQQAVRVSPRCFRRSSTAKSSSQLTFIAIPVGLLGVTGAVIDGSFYSSISVASEIPKGLRYMVLIQT